MADETLVRLATLDDLRTIENIRHKEWENIGFIPITRYEEILTVGHGRDTIYVAEENNDVVGFLFGNGGGQSGTVWQVAVYDDARRLEHGTNMLEAFTYSMRSCGKFSLRCRVAVDIEAHAFWQAVEFQPIGESKGRFLWKNAGPKSRTVIQYEKMLQPRLVP